MAGAVGSPAVSMLATEIAVRYHFAGTEQCFFTLTPFRNRAGLLSRFYGLGSVGNTFEMKFMQALCITPASHVDRASEGNVITTLSPYTGENLAPETQPDIVVTPAADTQDELAALAGARREHTILADGRWQCAYCQYRNYANKEACNRRICRAPRSGSPPPSSPPPSPQLGSRGQGKAVKKTGGVMTKEEFEAEEEKKKEKEAKEEARRNAPKRVSLYAAQKPTKNKKKKG
jgi:hypothetical protein